MQEISGTTIARKVIARLKEEKSRHEGIFAAVLVGDDPLSESFVKRKELVARDLDLDFRTERFPATCGEDELITAVDALAARSDVKGVMIQLPLPAVFNAQRVLDRVPEKKDVDVLGSSAFGSFYTGRNIALPPAVGAFKEIVEAENASLEKSVIAVVGLGRLIGRPVAVWLAERARTIYLIDKGGEYGRIKDADIVVIGAGAGNLIDVQMVKQGALVIDFGYAAKEANGKMCLCGDFVPAGAREKGVRYTPTPGGTGPILVAKLFENFYLLNDE